jgi:hypothetical protein
MTALMILFLCPQRNDEVTKASWCFAIGQIDVL